MPERISCARVSRLISVCESWERYPGRASEGAGEASLFPRWTRRTEYTEPRGGQHRVNLNTSRCSLGQITLKRCIWILYSDNTVWRCTKRGVPVDEDYARRCTVYSVPGGVPGKKGEQHDKQQHQVPTGSRMGRQEEETLVA